CWLPRITRSPTASRGPADRSSRDRSLTERTALRFTPTSTAPAASPARAARLDGPALTTRTPPALPHGAPGRAPLRSARPSTRATLAVASVSDPHRRADPHPADPEGQVVNVPHLRAVHRDDHVAGLEPCLLGRGARLDLRDQRAPLDLQIERLRELRGHRLDVH